MYASKIHVHKSKEAKGAKREQTQNTHTQGREGLGRQHSERQLCLHQGVGASIVMSAAASMAQQLPVSAMLQ